MDERDDDRWTGERERRQSPRVDVPGRMQAHLLGLDVPVTVVQLGLGGFRLRTSFVFLVGSRHAFRFRLGDGSTVDVTAEVVHCLPRVTRDGAPVYVTGLAFVDADAANAAAAADLMDEASSQLSFDVG